MWAGVAYGCGCGGRVQKFGSKIIFCRGVVFLKSLAPTKSCHKIRFGEKKILKLWLFPPENFKTC
jgi:hypothetical protein